MKKLTVFTTFVIAAFSLHAQDFPGYRAGNYTGVNGVFFNPANIADSRFRFDIGLFSVSTLVGNDQASFKLSTMAETFGGDGLTDQLLNGQGGPASALVSANIHGPSFMFNLNKKSAIAITTRGRVLANIVEIDGKLLNELGDNPSSSGFPYTIRSDNNMRVAMNAWSEIGASYARVFTDKNKHFLKGGATVKYLGGAGNAFVGVSKLNATLTQENIAQVPKVYLTNTTGRLEVGFGGINFSDFEPDKFLKMESSGFGADLGLVYEYRPSGLIGRDQNKYKFKVGVSLLDLGSITYQKDMQRSGSYDLGITGSEKLLVDSLGSVDLNDYNAFFKSKPQYFTPTTSNSETSYSVSLPTTLNIDLDYRLHKGFYVSASGMFSMVKKGGKLQNSMYYSTFNVTPRFESRVFGVFLPITYNELTQLNAGLSVRLGPLFVGSGSLLSAMIGDSKQADVHIGLRFGSLQKKK